MEFLVFIIVAAVAIAASIMVVLQRNAMYSALFLVLAFFCFAVFYVLLGAYFLAVVQVAVYAGAIMVLMLFVIMLLNVAQPEPADRRLGMLRPFGAMIAAVLVLELLAAVGRSYVAPGEATATPAGVQAAGATLASSTLRAAAAATATPAASQLAVGAATAGHTQLLAATLFTRYLFPFEVTSILLLGAILGATILARKRPEVA